MKILFVFGIILVCISSHSEAYVGSISVPDDPAHPGQCPGAVYPETKMTYHNIGSTWKTGPCGSSECVRKNDRELEIRYSMCGLIRYPPECIPVPEDPSKPFPECCASARCP